MHTTPKLYAIILNFPNSPSEKMALNPDFLLTLTELHAIMGNVANINNKALKNGIRKPYPLLKHARLLDCDITDITVLSINDKEKQEKAHVNI